MERKDRLGYIVYTNDDHTEIGFITHKELMDSNGNLGGIVTEVKEIVAEGHNTKSAVQVLKGEDGKFYVCWNDKYNDNRVIDVLDGFKSNDKTCSCGEALICPRCDGDVIDDMMTDRARDYYEARMDAYG